jgi:hypothetical protein
MAGPRVYLRGRRVHHGLFGALLTLAGAALCWHDRRDWPWPTIDPK